MLWVTDADAECLLLNHGWRNFRGVDVDNDVAHGWSHAIHEEDRDRALATFRSAHQKREPYKAEYRVRRADGVFRWVHDHGEPWFDRHGRFMGQMGCCVDITDQRTHEWTAANAERRLNQLVEMSRDLIYRLRLFPSPAVEYVGGAVEAITGQPPEALYADPFLAQRSVHPDDRSLVALTPDQAASLPVTVICRWMHADGRIVWAEHHQIPVFDAAGRIVGLEGIARDVTGRIESERKLRESEEQLRKLAARLQSAREEERAEVSRDLHDELGQTLTALKLDVNRAVAAFDSDPRGVTTMEHLQSVVGLVDVGIATVKRISARLRPATLDHLGLAEAVRWEALTFKTRTGIRCQVQSNRQQTRLNTEQQTALFRIVQEALNNVVCHANASSVRVSIKETDDLVELRIRDNGRGVTSEQVAAPGSIGLLGMKERAALVGGTFTVSGQRGKGTVVSVHVPLGDATAAVRPRAQGETQLG
jgi:two-component system, NarL family, sensor histidine kinase UhpB